MPGRHKLKVQFEFLDILLKSEGLERFIDMIKSKRDSIFLIEEIQKEGVK